MDERQRAFNDFQKMKEYAREVKSRLQSLAGYSGSGSIHFATAYFPVIYNSGIEVWKGDTFAGSIGISPMTGLLKITEGGDFGPHEWGEDRCFNALWGISLDAFKEDLSHCCLDEGIGLGDKSLFLNIDRINDDMAHCKDPLLDKGDENVRHKI